MDELLLRELLLELLDELDELLLLLLLLLDDELDDDATLTEISKDPHSSPKIMGAVSVGNAKISSIVT